MFSEGETVICVDDTMLPHTVEQLTIDVPNWVKKGQTYTIRSCIDHGFVVGVYLKEIHNPPRWFDLVGGFIEPAFKSSRFRKLESKTTKIEIEESELLIA